LAVVNTDSLWEGFFSCRRTAQERLAGLRAKGLLATSVQGLPFGDRVGALRYWHLTARGCDAVGGAWPHEPLPDPTLLPRLSLRNFEHRDLCNRVYLALIRGADMAEVRARADLLAWSADGARSLPYRRGTLTRRIVPDAVLTAAGSARIFIEIDRSSETVHRCRDILVGYESVVAQGGYAKAFGDDREPYVVYLTRSDARRAHLAAAASAAHLVRVRTACLTYNDGIAWLHEAVFGSRFSVAPFAVAPRAVTPRATRPLSPPMRELLTDLAAEFESHLLSRIAAGEELDFPPTLRAAQDALASHEVTG
jgi:hypothetical protein